MGYALPHSRLKGRMMSDYETGSMDIRQQEKTFAGFIRMITWGAVLVAVILIVMALSNA